MQHFEKYDPNESSFHLLLFGSLLNEIEIDIGQYKREKPKSDFKNRKFST